jgi:leader peptidase (prepilin peptidase) / N-methyltransferase
MPLALVPAALFGLVIGSFLNVVAHRLPRGASLVKPRSACPQCGTPVRPYDNIPVLSWLLLRGRCRDCSAPISGRYPLVEAGTGVLWLAVVAVHHTDTTAMALGLILVTLLVPIALIDAETQTIPNSITYPGALVLLTAGLALDPAGEPERVIAALAGGLFFFCVVFAYPRGMGLGDAKLVFVMGLALGRDLAPAILVGLLAGSIVGAAIIARVGVQQGRKTKVPFGPFLALGGVFGLLAGGPLMDWYVSTL